MKTYTIKEVILKNGHEFHSQKLIASLDDGSKVYRVADYKGFLSILVVCSKKIKIETLINIKRYQPQNKIFIKFKD